MSGGAWSIFKVVYVRTWMKTIRRPVVLIFSFIQPMMWMLFFGFLFHRYALDAITGDLTMSLMTPSKVLVQEGALTLSALPLDADRESADGKVLFDADVFEVTTETYPLAEVSFKRGNPWGEKLTRTVLKVRNLREQGEWSIRVVR